MNRGILLGNLLILVTISSLCLFSEASAESVINLGVLLDETTNLERLATAESMDYITRQFSSYDRKSTDPAVLTEENWFANADRGHCLRKEWVGWRSEYVLMEADGPGVIVRFWSANPNDGGTVKIYLDHQESPVIEMPLETFLGGTAEPFIAPLCGERSRGWNCYFPIAYAKHCKVTISRNDIYYVIDYRTYKGETQIKTFTMEEAQAQVAKIQDIAGILATPFQAVDANKGQLTPYEVTLTPGMMESTSVAGPAAVYRITCKIAAKDVEAALRQCVVVISFDGRSPGVMAPLGDFFGTAPGLNPYQSLPSGVLEDGTLYSHWVMPFKEKAVITVHNHSGEAMELKGEIGVVNRPWTDDSLYFHAKWRSEKDIPTRPMKDWNYVTTSGAGRFCGVMLHIANPVVNWWGEGDEKIYVDGETFPSFFGTGSEDYFGYAWCNPALFTHAYHNQVRCDGPGNMGHTCVSRFHIMDDIPFRRSLKFDLEVWHSTETKVTQAIMAYWYGFPDITDNFPPINPDLLNIPILPGPPGVEGALEGEKMRIAAVSGGEADSQQGPWPWSRAAQLWWRHAAPGDTLKLAFDVEEAASWEVMAAFTLAPDYGIHQLFLNGEQIGDPMDFYHEEVIVDKERSLGRFMLKQGENLLEVKIVGHRPEAQPGNMFGLDYLRLVR